MDTVFQYYPTRDAVLSAATKEVADRLLLELAGDSLNRGNFGNAVYQRYGGDEEVVKAYLTAWSELVRGGYLVEKRDPGWFFMSPSGHEERARLNREGTRRAEPPRIVAGRWQVLRQLSGGGQGLTSIVRDVNGSPDERFVLKELRSGDEQARQRFATETKALASLDHPNILRVLASDTAATPPWYVSEYCEGHGLDKAPLADIDLATRLRFFLDICKALGAAHGKGITHRDIKPENVLLKTSNGPAVLGDFGICWFAEEERLTRANEDIGSSFCRAPELFDGPLEIVSPASDIYCLGKLLYWLVVGKGGRIGRLRGEEFENPDKPDKNLINILRDQRYEHINNVLRRMIVEDQSRRFTNGDEAYEECMRAFELLTKGHHPLNRPPDHCSYCGLGTYREHATGSGTATELSLLQKWRIFECSECGNTLFFRKNQRNTAW